MTRIDFYVLSNARPKMRELFACRLTEKAYKLGRRVFIQTESESQSRAIDDLLWTFRQGSFVPHAQLVDKETDTVVLIGHEGEPNHIDDVLINLSPEVPRFFSRFVRVAELVDDTETVRASARERFRFYRDRGYSLASHEINQE